MIRQARTQASNSIVLTNIGHTYVHYMAIHVQVHWVMYDQDMILLPCPIKPLKVALSSVTVLTVLMILKTVPAGVDS